MCAIRSALTKEAANRSAGSRLSRRNPRTYRQRILTTISCSSVDVTLLRLRLLPVTVTPRPALALSGQGRTQVGEAVRPPSALMMQHQAGMPERLICEAETALVSQTVHPYRRWYSCWRRRGVKVSDLLDMTWARRQRASAD